MSSSGPYYLKPIILPSPPNHNKNAWPLHPSPLGLPSISTVLPPSPPQGSQSPSTSFVVFNPLNGDFSHPSQHSPTYGHHQTLSPYQPLTIITDERYLYNPQCNPYYQQYMY